MIKTGKYNKMVSDVLTGMGIVNRISREQVAVNRTSMVNAYPTLDEEAAYKFIGEFVRDYIKDFEDEIITAFWGSKTDEELFFDVYIK